MNSKINSQKEREKDMCETMSKANLIENIECIKKLIKIDDMRATVKIWKRNKINNYLVRKHQNYLSSKM